MNWLFKRAEETPHEVALSDSQEHYTWRELAEVILRTASALEDSPAARERPVAVCAQNSAEVVIVIAAATLARVPLVPLSYHLSAEELSYIVQDANCRLVVADSHTLAGVLAARAEGREFDIVMLRAASAGSTEFRLWTAGRTLHVPEWDAPAAANLMYTSGTTGRPKGVLPPQAMSATPLKASLEIGLPERGPHLIAGPLYHGGPMRGSRHLWVGAPMHVLERFDPEEALRRIDSQKIASSTMVPTHFKRMLSLPKTIRDRYDVSSLRRVIHTGAPCPADLKREMIAWWGPVLVDYYGGTESGTLCMIESEEWLQHPGSVGRPLPGVEVIARDEAGAELPHDCAGRLYFRHESGFVPRYRGAAAGGTAQPRADGTFTLGEIGYVDPEGFVFITDRGGDLVLSGGVNIYPAETERVLLADDRISDAVCIGVPDADMGERLIALIERSDSHPSFSASDVAALCRSQLSAVKCPKEIHFVSATGRNAMGKANRRHLRDAFVANGGPTHPASENVE